MTGINVDGRGATVEGRGVQAGEVSALPDSAIHRWILDDVNGTISDSIGSVDGSNSGVTSVSGTYQGGSAGYGDGGDLIDMGVSLSQHAQDLTQSNFSFAYTIDDYTGGSNDPIYGGEVQNNVKFVMDDFGPGINFIGEGPGGNGLRVRASDGSLVDDGNKHRVVWICDGLTGSDWRLYVDNTEVSTTVDRDEGLSEFVDEPMYMFSTGEGNNYITAVLDDVIIYGDLLTATEVDGDYNAQPWT